MWALNASIFYIYIKSNKCGELRKHGTLNAGRARTHVPFEYGEKINNIHLIFYSKNSIHVYNNKIK